MKLSAAVASISTVLVPALAFACPAAAAHACGSCGGSILGYALALAAGVAAGLGSVAVEKRFLK
jgi:hypothetical protein